MADDIPNPFYTSQKVPEKEKANRICTQSDAKSIREAPQPSPPPAGEQKKPEKSRSKRCWVITTIVLMIVIGVGVGVGVGVSQTKEKEDDQPSPSPPPPSAATSNEAVANLTVVKNKLLDYIPIDIQRADTKELVESYVAQVARAEPLAQLLAFVLPMVGQNLTVVQPQAIQILLQTWMEDNKVDSSSLASTLDSLAQLAQGVLDFQKNILPIASSLGSAMALVRRQLDGALNSTAPLGGGSFSLSSGSSSSGRRSLTAHRDLLQTDMQAFIRRKIESGVQTVLSSAAAAPFVDELRRLYDPATLPELVVDLYLVLMRLMGASDELREVMDRLDTHLDLSQEPSLPIYNPRTDTNLTTLANRVPYDKRTAMALPAVTRRLLQQTDPLQAALLQTQLPPGFKPAPGTTQPRVLIPLVFHVMTYRQSGGYGPPNWDKAPEYVSRIVKLVNAMAFRSNFSFFINEVRYDPVANPYLLKSSRAAWASCSSDGNYVYKACSEVLNGAKDFPRSINVLVAGDKASASYAGYGWVPSSATNLATGHVALLWSVLDTAQWNSQSGWEYGAKVLWHEIMHHLGLYHNFGVSSTARGCASTSDDGVDDTPVVAGPVYNQGAFDKASRTYCLEYFSRELSGSWAKVEDAWRDRLGIPAADADHGFDSCPSQPGNDELGNFIAYTHDVCIAALGHVTAGQVRYMHNVTQRIQGKMYQWGQYFATQAPAAFDAPPAAPKPPPPPAAPLSACLQTRGGCRCRTSWSFGGSQLTGCANPDGDRVGLWCPVEQDGNCASALNGHWDYCAPAASQAACSVEFPQPPTSPPLTPSTPRQQCGAGWATLSGSTCSRDPWAFVDADGMYNTSYTGCANPDNDPQGPWCRLQPGFTTLLGRTWDYCGPQCRILDEQTGSDGASPNATSAAPCVTSQGLPAGCTCRATWGVILLQQNVTAGAVARRYTTARQCTVLPELQPPGEGAGTVGVCEVTGCNDAKNNGRVMVCSSPCTTLMSTDGEDAGR